MPRRTLNLGILAHVDAGKTTLTERLLYAAGVIDTVGDVDAGTTQTDTLALERQRGITIRSAVVSFEIAGVTVNLIDTPGHPDFIAEVERVLSLLDGAVLVISAVEGVQPQTRVLMRALRRLRVPTLLFVNKIDRRGAGPRRVLREIAGRLTASTVALGTVDGAGTRSARFTPYGFDDPAFQAELVGALAERDDSLMAGLVELLPAGVGDPRAAVSARVFKIDLGPAGEKIAYVRMFAGTVGIRQRLPIQVAGGGAAEAKATGISVSDNGGWVRRRELVAGQIGKLWGLDGIRIGDTIGQPPGTGTGSHFAPPTMETVVAAVRRSEDGALRVALARLAEQDPLINVRADETGAQVAVSLYGEVQKQVIQATLATEFAIDVTFRETTVICVERPVRVGEAVEILNSGSNPFQATIGLRVEPGPPDSGVQFRIRVEPQAMPLYIYRNAGTFVERMDRHVRRALREGLSGWQVTDCVITMIDCGYSVADGPPSKRGPTSTPADFRHLTPMVLMRALDRAGTVVCEPSLKVTIETPVRAINGILTALGRLAAAVTSQSVRGELTTIESVVPAARVQDLQRQLPRLTAGEGVLESTFDSYRPVRADPPSRPRTTADPRHREQYLISLTRQGGRG